MSAEPIWIDYKLQMKYNYLTLRINFYFWSELQDAWWNSDKFGFCHSLKVLLTSIHILTFLRSPPDFPQKKVFVEIPVGFSLVTELKAGRKKNSFCLKIQCFVFLRELEI